MTQTRYMNDNENPACNERNMYDSPEDGVYLHQSINNC